MNKISSVYEGTFGQLHKADWMVPTAARLVFAGVLLVYFLNAGMTKLGDGLAGLWTPPAGAYAQIFPRALEAAGYDTDALGLYHKLVVLLGTWAELVLPVLIVLGLLTRIASLAMIGFVAVQSLTDVLGHGQADATGAWFDRFPDAIILDQRALWMFLLFVLLIKGAGPISFDRALRPRSSVKSD